MNLQRQSMTKRKTPNNDKRHPSSALYSSRIIKAGALIGDTKTLLSHWDASVSVAENIDRIQRDNVFGKAVLAQVSAQLTAEFGKGFDASNLYKMSQFYRAFPNLDALRLNLSWTHYRLLLRVDSATARDWYMNESATQNWNTRALERQLGTLYYERLLTSKDRQPVRDEAAEKLAEIQATPREFIRDPVLLEFLGLPGTGKLLESKLEHALIDNLQAFLLELGKGFSFVARQQRLSTETKDFYIDLVFYNYLLKCFVIFDLKTRELTHQDIGQMDMYVRLYDDQRRSPDDGPTVGIILCAHKDHTVVRYSVLHGNEQLFASKYKLILPSEEELRAELLREQELLSAADLKLIINAVSWRVEDAPAVIKKTHKPGKMKPDPLRGLFEAKIDGKTCVVEYEPDSELRDFEQIPLLEEGGIEAFIKREVLPYTPDAWLVEADTKIGYEVSFTRHFYQPPKLRTLAQISADILALEQETEGLLHEITKGVTA